MADDATTGSRRARGRRGAAIAGLVLAAIFVVVYRQVLGITQRPSWPPPADAVTSAGAQAATEAFVARDGTRPHDAALPFAWSTAATIEPLVEGASFFPRIFADVEAAQSSVHILMFGWREGEVGMEMAALLRRKLAEGVEVRVIVDSYGSRPYEEAREMFTGLADAGAQIVVNDVFPLDRDGLFPDGQHIDWRQDEVGRADHRKLYVIDGAVAWTGGAGIEDHFRERRLPRRDGSRHRRRRPAGAGRVPDELSRARRPARRRPLDLLPRARRRGLDADRARAGDSRRPRRSIAGDPRADRRRARGGST